MVHIIENFNQIAHNYKAMFCDLWGCLHNGKESFKEGLEALYHFRNSGGIVILLTNAPRPGEVVIEFIKKLGITIDHYDEIITSGDAAQFSLASGDFGQNIYHIGPQRDLCFFNLHKFTHDHSLINLVSISEASSIVCTGLFNDQTEDPSDYQNIINLGIQNKLPLLCANPDIQVDYGHQRLWCAGAIADNYSKAGGESVYFGKPHKPIYDLAMSKLYDIDSSISKSEIICIGDGILTDISGGISNNLDTLFVTGGLSSKDVGIIKESRIPNEKKLKEFLSRFKLTPTASIGYFQ
ncbi:MAG: TIGR01459 family HAD-type hydrolase [Paracoccaceae bacterium]|nr:TIGR01459 family HAD-type hydrolase [Paracoccaceae bacterium]